MKRLLRDGGQCVVRFLVIHSNERADWPLEKVLEQISFPFFVKPANAGSSFGIAKVKTGHDFQKALDDAFLFDHKILIEEAIVGRELECSILGNEEPIASLPCEIVPHGEFHSYSSKYLDKEGATFHIPAKLEPDEVALVQKEALKARSAHRSGL